MTDKQRRTRSVFIMTAAPLAAAAALVIALTFPDAENEGEPIAEVVDDVVRHHVRELPMEIESPDPQEAASWFRGKVDFPVRAPKMNLRNANFQGARLSNVRAHQAAHMTYLVDGRRVTLMIFNPRKTSFSGGHTVQVDGRNVLLGRHKGFNVAILLDGDMAYALSSDLPQKQLLKLASNLNLGF